MFAQARQADRQDDDLFGESISPNQLPKELAKLRQKEAERKTGSNESKETDEEMKK